MPPTASRTITAMLIFCRIDRLAQILVMAFSRSAQFAPAYIDRRNRAPTLHLHAHDFLVRAHYLIAYLEEQVEGELGLLRRHDGGVQLLALAREKPLDRRRRRLSRPFDVLDGAGQHL